ncbi:hypothetical protein BGI30_10935 [Snodgrassella alvi]|uniref:Uncharacterized protein n=1 Tax=Snodgrassella alvi TaxID=1196083 RepID=A0A855FNN9_9NEIS|nr:hypothetical protein BGI30_10935 [Snodgrassella alvi]PIT57105.1 hypothetical protein BHC59_06280 [Snodgrassella alvi]PIT59997.1 hypothetical protein BHC57_06945 [Snodgrassella alvi]
MKAESKPFTIVYIWIKSVTKRKITYLNAKKKGLKPYLARLQAEKTILLSLYMQNGFVFAFHLANY